MKPLIQFSSIVDTGVKLWSQLLKDNTPVQMNGLLKPGVTPEYNRPKHHLIVICRGGGGGGGHYEEIAHRLNFSREWL